jgi:hypothetical protein
MGVWFTVCLLVYYQRRQLGDKIQWLKDDVRGPIAVGRFELISGIPRRHH